MIPGALSGGGSPESPSQCSSLGGLGGGHNGSDLGNAGKLLLMMFSFKKQYEKNWDRAYFKGVQKVTPTEKGCKGISGNSAKPFLLKGMPKRIGRS